MSKFPTDSMGWCLLILFISIRLKISWEDHPPQWLLYLPYGVILITLIISPSNVDLMLYYILLRRLMDG